MKKSIAIYVFAVLAAIVNNCFAQVPDIAWQKTFGGTGNDIMQDIYPTADGNYILLGLSSVSDVDVSCNIEGKHDTWVIKMDPVGDIIWQQCYGGTKEEGNPNSKIIQTSDGGYIFQTETWSSDGDVTGHHELSDAWTVKLNSLGGIEWAHSFGGSNWDVPRRLVELPGKRYLILARSTSSDGDVPANIDSLKFDAWVFIVDSTGSIISNNIYGGTGDDELSDALLLPNGNLALFGQTSSKDGDLTSLPVDSTDAWLLIIDTSGNIITNRVYGQQDFEDFISAVATDDGGFVCFGETGDPGIPVDHGSWHGNMDFWAVKLDANNDIQWQGVYGGSDKEQFRDAATLPYNGGYYLAGTSMSADGDIADDEFSGREWWIMQITTDGILLWNTLLGGSDADFCYSILDNAIAVGGTYSADGDVMGLDGDADGWVLQLDVATVTHQLSGGKGTVLVYPVPASNNLHIQIDGFESGKLVEVINLLGQKLYSAYADADEVILNLHHYNSGCYLLKVSDAAGTIPQSLQVFQIVK
ncbi:MAG: T9SS type A sorting domain-containing protein [Chitinophagales bacterium]